jgi:DNA polymerase III subunit epsilon
MPTLSGLMKMFGRHARRAPEPAPAAGREGGGEEGGEIVALAAAEAGTVRIAAVRVRGRRILSGSHLDLVVGPGGIPAGEAAERLLSFVGDRPLLGCRPCEALDLLARHGVPFPPPAGGLVDVAALHGRHRAGGMSEAPPGQDLDGILADLGLPPRSPPGPLGDAVSAALAWLRLTEGEARPALTSRPGPPTACS